MWTVMGVSCWFFGIGKGETMIQILYKATSPCFQCGKTEKTAVVIGKEADKEFSAILCMEHAWSHVPAVGKEKKKKGGNDAPASAGGGKAT